MTTKKDIAIPEIEQAEAAMKDIAASSAPMVQREQSHRDKMDIALKELESERFDLTTRRDQFRRQADAVDLGLAMHIDDIDRTISLYQAALGVQQKTETDNG